MGICPVPVVNERSHPTGLQHELTDTGESDGDASPESIGLTEWATGIRPLAGLCRPLWGVAPTFYHPATLISMNLVMLRKSRTAAPAVYSRP